MGEEEDDDAAELGERDAGEDGGTHVDDGVVCAPDARALGRDGEGTCDVGTELHRYTDGHHQIHLSNGGTLAVVVRVVEGREIGELVQ